MSGWSVVRGRGGVLLVGDVLEPGHDLAVVVGFLGGDVRHNRPAVAPCQCSSPGSMWATSPGADLVRLTAASGDVPDAVGDVERLALGVVMPGVRAPGVKRTWAQPIADWSSGLRMPSM